MVIDEQAQGTTSPDDRLTESGGSEGARALSELGERSSRILRRQYADEVARHRDAIAQLERSDESLRDALRSVSFDAAERVGEARIGAALDRPVPVLDRPATSSGLFVRGAPYDFDWSDRKDWGDARADRGDGSMSLGVWSGATPGDTDHTWNGSGVGIRFTVPRNVDFMRVACYLPYAYRWHDDSSLSVARNRGNVGTFIRQVGGKLKLNHLESLWSDGTGWYEEHSDDQDGVFNTSSFVFVEPGADMEIWIWVNSSIDYGRSSSSPFDVGSSQASNSLSARLGFIVVEPFGH